MKFSFLEPVKSVKAFSCSRVEQSCVNSGGEPWAEGALEECTLTLRPLFEKPREISIEGRLGGHGGGDPILLNDLFRD
jgi:hypothetical protein